MFGSEPLLGGLVLAHTLCVCVVVVAFVVLFEVGFAAVGFLEVVCSWCAPVARGWRLFLDEFSVSPGGWLRVRAWRQRDWRVRFRWTWGAHRRPDERRQWAMRPVWSSCVFRRVFVLSLINASLLYIVKTALGAGILI